MGVRLKDYSKAEKNRRKGQAFLFFFFRSQLLASGRQLLLLLLVLSARTHTSPSLPLLPSPAPFIPPPPRPPIIYSVYHRMVFFLQCTFLCVWIYPSREIRASVPVPISTSVCSIFMCQKNGMVASVWNFYRARRC